MTECVKPCTKTVLFGAGKAVYLPQWSAATGVAALLIWQQEHHGEARSTSDQETAPKRAPDLVLEFRSRGSLEFFIDALREAERGLEGGETVDVPQMRDA